VKTFKQMVQENPNMLNPKEDIYINRKFYNWGETDIKSIDFDSITDVYDLCNCDFYYKTPLPFQITDAPSSTIFKRLDNDKEIDLEPLFDMIVERSDDLVLFQINYPNKFFQSSCILMIINKDEYEQLSLNEK